jgi:hypothetical protein
MGLAIAFVNEAGSGGASPGVSPRRHTDLRPSRGTRTAPCSAALNAPNKVQTKRQPRRRCAFRSVFGYGLGP